MFRSNESLFTEEGCHDERQRIALIQRHHTSIPTVLSSSCLGRGGRIGVERM